MSIAIQSSLLTSILGNKTVSLLSSNAKSELTSFISNAVSDFFGLLLKGNMNDAFAYVKQAEIKFQSLVQTDIKKSGPTDIDSSSSLVVDEHHTGSIGKLVAENGWDSHLPNIAWSIVGGKDANSFTIGKEGMLSVSSNFKYSIEKSATIIVSATDDFGRSYSKTLSVKINNETPTDLSLTKVLGVSEQSVVGTVVGTLYTVSPDAKDKFIYTIDGNNGFAVKENTLVTTKVLNAGDYVLNVTSTEKDGLSITKPITVHIDRAFLPTDITLSATHITEASVAGTVVANLGVVDSAVNETFKYSITGGKDAADFSVNGTSLIALNPFFSLATPTKEINLTVTDHLGYSYTKVVDISVDDVAPYALTFNQNGSVYSNAATSSLVGTLHASDLDPNNHLTYSLSGTDSNLFHTDVSGNILISSAIGWNGGVARQFDATATDVEGLSVTQHYSVRAQGVAPSDIGVSATTVNDGVKAGTSVSVFTAVGEDPTDPVTWQLSGIDASKFLLSGNTLVAASDVSFAQSGSALHVTVKATEFDGASFSKDVIIGVNPPLNTNTGLSGLRLTDYGVSEGLPSNHIIAKILEDGATTPVALSIVGGTNAAHFSLQGDSLVLNSTETNYLTPTLNVVVQGTDALGHSVTQSFNINILPATYTAGSGNVYGTTGVDVFLPDPSSGIMTIHNLSEPGHDQVGLQFVFTQDQINSSTVRLTGNDDLNVHVQINKGTGWTDAAILNAATSSDGTLNGDSVADPLTQARLDTLSQSWIANHTIHS